MVAVAPPTSEILATLSAYGLAASAQRIALLASVLSTHDRHPSAGDLYRSLADQFPTLSRATIYNNLSALATAGLIEKLDTPDGSRYGPVARPHVNLVCTECGAIRDVLVGDSQLGILVERAAAAGTFKAQTVSVCISGFCAGCRG